MQLIFVVLKINICENYAKSNGFLLEHLVLWIANNLKTCADDLITENTNTYKLFSNKFENHIFSILVVNFCHLAVCAFWLWPSSRSSTTSFFCFFARNSLDRHIEWEKTCSFVHMCVCVCDSVSYLYDCVCVCVRMVLCSCVSTFVCIRKRVTVSYISIQF